MNQYPNTIPTQTGRYVDCSWGPWRPRHILGLGAGQGLLGINEFGLAASVAKADFSLPVSKPEGQKKTGRQKMGTKEVRNERSATQAAKEVKQGPPNSQAARDQVGLDSRQ